MKSEQTIQAEILLAINQKGHRCWRSNAGRVKNEAGYYIKLFPAGFPDLLGYRKGDGKFFVIEVKNQKGKLRDDQKKFADFAEGQPILYGVARSVEDAMEIIEGD